MPNDLHSCLERILQSEEFAQSVNNKKLLKYLVESSEKGVVPKEFTIAYEVYGIDSDKSGNEVNIRVYIYNLRKKLDSYYQNEGSDDRYRLKIPVGRYKVVMVKNESKKISKRTVLSKRFIVSIAILLIVNVSILVVLANRDKVDSKDYPVWSSYIDSDVPILLVVGDFFVSEDKSLDKRHQFIRDSRVNSEEDLDSLLQEFPELDGKYTPSKLSFLGKFAPFSVNELACFFAKFNKSVELILSSEFEWQHLQNYNVVYLGSFKTLRLFDYYLKNSNFEYSIYPNRLYFKDIEEDSVYTYHALGSDLADAHESDYPVVTMIPGPENHHVMLFISSRDIGVLSAIKYFTDIANQDSIEENIMFNEMDTPWFESCFKVLGVHRNPINIDLLHVNNLEVDALFEK